MTPPEVGLNRLLAGQSAITLACAESCTGGEIASRITSIPGSSDYFPGGVITYANATKVELLDVSAETLRLHGAVSAECAVAMAEGARRLFHATLAVSTTGIAGPGGATATKPAGLVYIAVASPAETVWQRSIFDGDRASVIEAASTAALEWLLSQTAQWTKTAAR